ncbi:MAG: GtrA family protein [Candidatus Moranbacteria bacterium]|nr:GtrA family protein [Candidatus Moranbacteria bacterium]
MIKLLDAILNKLLDGKVPKSVQQFVRYLFAGGTATVADMTSLFLLTHFLHINYLVAAAIGFVIGVTTNYLMNIALVFESTGKIKREFSLFAMVGIGGLLWTELILWILVDKFGIYLMVSKAVAVVLVLNWNFFMRKKFVFAAKPNLVHNSH